MAQSPKFAAGCTCYYCGKTQPTTYVKQGKPVWLEVTCPNCHKPTLRIVAPLAGLDKDSPAICGNCGQTSTVTARKLPNGYRADAKLGGKLPDSSF